eukprot:1142195-Pelagomonas_calceolata.AAC.4
MDQCRVRCINITLFRLFISCSPLGLTGCSALCAALAQAMPKLIPLLLSTIQALQKQAEDDDTKLPKDFCTHLRLKGYCSPLLALCISPCRPARRAALVVMRAGARVDMQLNAQLLKEGVVSKLLPLVKNRFHTIKVRANQPPQPPIEAMDLEDLHNMGHVFRILGRQPPDSHVHFASYAEEPAKVLPRSHIARGPICKSYPIGGGSFQAWLFCLGRRSFGQSGDCIKMTCCITRAGPESRIFWNYQRRGLEGVGTFNL